LHREIKGKEKLNEVENAESEENRVENLDLLRKCPKELDGVQGQIIVTPSVPFVCLSQPDETGFHRLRNIKRELGSRIPFEILVVRLPINLRPILPIQRTLNNPRFQIATVSPDCVVSRADPHFVEIPANPLASLVL
jgi:hypothetical protein